MEGKRERERAGDSGRKYRQGGEKEAKEKWESESFLEDGRQGEREQETEKNSLKKEEKRQTGKQKQSKRERERGGVGRARHTDMQTNRQTDQERERSEYPNRTHPGAFREHPQPPESVILSQLPKESDDGNLDFDLGSFITHETLGRKWEM